MRYWWWLLAGTGGAIFAATVMLSAARGEPEPYEILWGGDTFLGDRGTPLLEAGGYDAAFQHLPPLDRAELTVVNAEAPLTNVNLVPPNAEFSTGSTVPRYDVFTSRGRVTRYVHRASPAGAAAFANAGIDVASLANNHAMDQGPEGMAETWRVLLDAGLTPVGAGQTIEEASRPRIVPTPFGRVGIFGFGEEGGTAPNATDLTPGIFALTGENVDRAQEIARAEDLEWMVAMVHWGNNYVDVRPEQVRWAERLEKAGFDLVVGTGPHIVQRIEIVERMPVLYSIGNLAFMTAGRFDEIGEPGVGLLVTTELSGRGFRTLRITCLNTDNKATGYQPRACTDEQAALLLPQLAPGIDIEGATGTLRW